MGSILKSTAFLVQDRCWAIAGLQAAREIKRSALVHARFGPDPPAMAIDDPLLRRQPYSSSLEFLMAV